MCLLVGAQFVYLVIALYFRIFSYCFFSDVHIVGFVFLSCVIFCICQNFKGFITTTQFFINTLHQSVLYLACFKLSYFALFL